MIAYILIVAGLFARLIPHAPNFVPVMAIAVFAGAYLDKKAAPWIPLLVMVLSDLVIGLHDMVIFTWGAFLLIGILSTWLKSHRTLGNVFAASVFSAVIFFLITNVGVWLSWYPHNYQGLADCFIKAVPFFRNTLVSNVVFTFVLFGLYELARKLAGETKYRPILIAE